MKDTIKKDDIFDSDAIRSRYEGMPLEELHSRRNDVLARIWGFQQAETLLSETEYEALLDMKIEIALLEKMIYFKRKENLIICPDCGLLCSTDEKVCRRCGNTLPKSL